MTRRTDEEFAQLMKRCTPDAAPSQVEQDITAAVRRELFPDADANPASRWRAWAESMLGTNPATRAASDADLRRGIQQQLQERARLRALASLNMRPPACSAVDKALEVLTLIEVGGGTPNLGDIAELLRTLVKYRHALETLEERIHHGEDVADLFADVLHDRIPDEENTDG